MSVAVYNHYKRLHNNMSINKSPSENAITNISNQQQQQGIEIKIVWLFLFSSSFLVLFLMLAFRFILCHLMFQVIITIQAQQQCLLIMKKLNREVILFIMNIMILNLKKVIFLCLVQLVQVNKENKNEFSFYDSNFQGKHFLLKQLQNVLMYHLLFVIVQVLHKLVLQKMNANNSLVFLFKVMLVKMQNQLLQNYFKMPIIMLNGVNKVGKDVFTLHQINEKSMMKQNFFKIKNLWTFVV